MKPTRFLLTLLCLLLSAVAVKASNPYKIPDELYAIFEMAHKTDNLERKFAISDSMFQIAKDRKDVRSQCVALFIPMRYYYNNRISKERLFKVISQIEELSHANKEYQVYYYARALKCNYLKNGGLLLEAMKEADEMKSQANEDQSNYGIYSSLRVLGNIYEARNEYQMALQKYEEALKYGQLDNVDNDVSPIYRAMGWCYLNLDQLETAIASYEKGIEEAKSDEPRIACRLQMCFVLYNLKRYDDFEKNYLIVTEYFKQHGGVQERYIPRLNTLHYIIQKDYALAEKEALKMNSPTDVLELQIMIEKARGNVAKALELTEKLAETNDYMQMRQHSEYLAELDANMGNTTLKLQTEQLERKQMQTLTYALGAGFLLVVIILILLAIFYRKSRQMNEQLSQKNQELARATAKAQESDELKTHFIQSISHEIRTPLNAVVGFSQYLSLVGVEISEAEKQELNGHILSSSNELTRIVNNMLEVSSLGSNSVKFQKTDFQVSELCGNLIDENRLKVPAGVNLRYESELPEGTALQSDPDRITQILNNFLSNSIKNTKQGEIVLSTKQQYDHLYFYVTDTGCGIPEDKAQNLFELFSKVDEYKAGMGLGLTICRMLALKLGGKVGFDPEYKNGARFWLSIKP